MTENIINFQAARLSKADHQLINEDDFFTCLRNQPKEVYPLDIHVDCCDCGTYLRFYDFNSGNLTTLGKDDYFYIFNGAFNAAASYLYEKMPELITDEIEGGGEPLVIFRVTYPHGFHEK